METTRSCHAGTTHVWGIPSMQKARLLFKEATLTTGLIATIIKHHEFPSFNTCLKGDTPIPLRHWLDPMINLSGLSCRKKIAYAVRIEAIYRTYIQHTAFYRHIETRDGDGKTPLIQMTCSGNDRAVQALIDARADLEARDRFGWSALAWAGLLREHTVMQLLTSAGADIEAYNHQQGRTILTHAIHLQLIETVRMLLGAGAEIEAREENTLTMLILATVVGEFKIVKMLLEKGADINAQDKKGNTALMYATSLGKFHIVGILLKASANVEMRDTDGNTALIHAAKTGQYLITRMLIMKGAQIEAKDNKGVTALMWAAVMRHKKTVEILLDARAKLEVCDHRGRTAILFAHPHMQIVSLLEERGANRKYAESILAIKSLSHAWGIEGQSILVNEKGNYTTFLKWAGWQEQFAMHMLFTHVTDFFKSNTIISDKLSKEDQEQICHSIANSFPLSNNHANFFITIESGRPLVILGGTKHHIIGLIMKKNKSNQYQLIVCNRGEGRVTNTTTYYLIPQSSLNESLVDKLTATYMDSDSFSHMLSNLTLQPIDGFAQKGQKVGNCTWANSKAIFRALLEWYTDRATAKIIYKTFSEQYTRNRTLEEYFTHFKPHELDRILLQQIKKKYEQKPGVLLSRFALEKLESALNPTLFLT